MSTKSKILISFLLVATGVLARLLPHAWNFAPIAGIALFSGAYLGRRYAIILPLVSLFTGDIFIGFYEWQLTLAVYGSFLLIGLFSAILQKYKNLFSVISLSLGSSILFFLVTNYAVWQFSPWYEKSVMGLIECYTMALPFFRGTVLGDMFYVGVFFGVYELALIAIKNKVILTKKTQYLTN
ncbi:MAG: hypothetical protein US83_C0003G0093 [Candidatus Falkowbacteria bacterium GW2011_GWC2_38_22]|uniref:Uncharacterized protein n=1 Tax=Candidatus Falkowbacteria bacterium GW2011_GWE1_38_31 TaxID=1618638 RepID=A0A0G0JUQ7_9BACT|nr:MAG: hypothetical protein US73_C0001G0185 [Candidatus Falkowbacteria bacterium GW2011_GWF2_38_1205]KKQ61844.1 MAG: hypothetical protein US83_C0003G0093 [Candidatus Falkowbacteria bacterium GW2011_GWC2_38_22]KKQ64152.1 MAG: hypothetical protein US84_C0002G0184 [Candidatus Falkowbacteria bacterium GW2011_GWF1_38_22]KKQ66498.1 MAG: hypothetical protein US87_C0001G0019 [Candidatus Falkowbacteria bacterium GW2011_GWE2_38_254]KKQ71258.1 MAG: hypothetical protein US91_C0001G0185 [Candidatus Falkowb